MLKKLAILLGLVSFYMIGHSQVQISQPYKFLSWVSVRDSLRAGRGDFDLTFQFPVGCGAPSGTASLNGGDKKKPAFFYDSCGHNLYLYTPQDSSWSILGTGGGGGVNSTNPSIFQLNFTAGDSLSKITAIAFDGSTTISQDSLGIRIQRTSNTTNVWDNRLILTNYGQTWTNTFDQTITFVPDFDPSSTVRQIGFGITTTGDNELWPILGKPAEYFGFIVKLGQDSSTSGYQGAVSSSLVANDFYAQRFFSGLIWRRGDIIQLNVRQSDRNQFYVNVINLSRNSKISAYLNYPLPNSIDTRGWTYHAGYPSMYCNGGNFLIKNYTFDPLATGVQLCWVTNSMGYGVGLDSNTNNNQYYTTFNKIKESVPFKSVLIGRSGTTTNDVNLVIKEISAYKPRYVVLDGIQTNDPYVSSNVLNSEANYLKLVKRIKALGIGVIHIVPAPRGTTDPSIFGTFHADAKNWIISTFPNDIIVNDFDTLLLSGTINTLNPIYNSDGSQTHMNVLGHEVRTYEFLKQTQFDFYRGQVTRVNADSVYSAKIYSDSLTNYLNATFHSNARVRGDFFASKTVTISDSSNTFTPLAINTNSTGFESVFGQNSNATGGAGIGLDFRNDLNRGFQFLAGSSTNGFIPDGLIIRSRGTGGILFSTDRGKMYWQLQKVVNNVGDSTNYMMELDTSVFRLKKPKLSIGTQAPTAYLHIKAGTSAPGTAPLKLTIGTNLSTPEDGAIEYDGSNYYASVSTTRFTIAKTLTTIASLDFGNTSAGTSSDMTVTVTGAITGDVVTIGVPNASVNANSSFTAWVSGADTVTVRFNNYSNGSIDPALGTFRVAIIKY